LEPGEPKVPFTPRISLSLGGKERILYLNFKPPATYPGRGLGSKGTSSLLVPPRRMSIICSNTRPGQLLIYTHIDHIHQHNILHYSTTQDPYYYQFRLWGAGKNINIHTTCMNYRIMTHVVHTFGYERASMKKHSVNSRQTVCDVSHKMGHE